MPRKSKAQRIAEERAAEAAAVEQFEDVQRTVAISLRTLFSFSKGGTPLPGFRLTYSPNQSRVVVDYPYELPALQGQLVKAVLQRKETNVEPVQLTLAD